MQPNYLDRVTEARKNTGQRAAQEQDLSAMLAELKKMQLAAMMGSTKPSVVLTDQTDLGDKISEAINKIATQISKLDTGDEQVAALKKMHGIFDGYFKRVGSDTASIVAAIKGIDIAPVVKAPVVHVPSIDFSPLQHTIREAMTSAESDEAYDRCDLSRYRAQDLTDTGDIQYVGFVNPEGNWYIIENDIKANKMRYVFGTSGYARHFRAAASYQYKILDKAYNAST